ncbi:MAG: DUF692 domain-containing protein [Myxococcaceae bacterium]
MKRVEGIGIGVRTPYASELLETSRRIDWLEIIPENWAFYGGKKRKLLRELGEKFPIVPHSVSLNVGGLDPLDPRFLDALAVLTKELGTPFFSDHVCFASTQGRPLHELLPLPFTEEAADAVGRRGREASERVGLPLVLENATFYAHMPSGPDGMTEAKFIAACLERSGAKMLLDVNNVYVNSKNHGFDARAFIDSLPLGQVEYLHLAGHTLQGDVIIDTHIGPIIDDVWSLYRYVIAKAGRVVPTLIEWDQDIPPLDVVLDEADRAREEAAAALRGAAP